jgi:hypothetical protein
MKYTVVVPLLADPEVAALKFVNWNDPTYPFETETGVPAACIITPDIVGPVTYLYNPPERLLTKNIIHSVALE